MDSFTYLSHVKCGTISNRPQSGIREVKACPIFDTFFHIVNNDQANTHPYSDE